MNSKHIGADMNYAPTAEKLWGAKGASEIIFKNEISRRSCG
jgi:hypothetical protein